MRASGYVALCLGIKMAKASFFAGSEIRRVFRNSSYLLCVHFGNYLVPLIVIFYLVKILGVESLGVYALCTAVAAYAQVVIDYGFSLTGCRAVAQNKSDSFFVSKTFWEILFSKFLVAGLTIFVCLSCFTWLALDLNLYFSAVLSAVFTSFTPIWFFQGLELFRGVAFLSFAGKVISCIPVLLWVRGAEDLYVVFYSQATFSFLVMLAVYFYVYRKGFVSKVPFMSLEIRERLFEGWHIFSATLSAVVITNGGTLWLGACYPSSVVGVYASVERLVKAVTSLFVPLGQAIYPINSRAFGEGVSVGIRSVIRTGIFFVAIGIVVAVAFFVSHSFFRDFFGYSTESVGYFGLFAAWIILGVVNNVMGAQLLTAGGYSHVYAKCFYVVAMVFVVVAYFMIEAYAGEGAVYSLLVAEAFLLVLLTISGVRVFVRAGKRNSCGVFRN